MKTMVGTILLLALVLGPFAAAPVSYLIGRKREETRRLFVAAVTVAEFVGTACLFCVGKDVSVSVRNVCGMGISFQADGFRMVFAAIAAYMWMMTTLFSGEYMEHADNRARYDVFLLITLGAVAGCFLSNDLFTVFIFFEMMSMASYVCVIHDEKRETMYAGAVYLAIAVIGGMVTLMGLFLLYRLAGTLSFSGLYEACQKMPAADRRLLYVSGFLILFGFGAKAGMYPLHVWLPMAHPVAPAPASALLSGIITKTGVLGVIILSVYVFAQDAWWGAAILAFGVVTMLCGGILAVFSVDLKRTLACSSMSQLGFVLVGIGMQGLLGEENALALRGTMLHMVNHSNLKLVLFMAAGVVVMNLHRMNLNDVRGFGRKKPLLAYAFLMGSLGIGGIPLWNGYVSKTLLHEAIVEYQELLEEGHAAFVVADVNAELLFVVVEWLFILTGAMTVAYMTKLFVAVFVEENRDKALQNAFDENRHYMNRLTAAVLAVSATVLPVLGLFPSLTQDRIADMGQGFLHGTTPAHAVHYFSFTNLKGGFYSIILGALIYVAVIRKWMRRKEADGSTVYVNRWPAQLDLLELVYRPVVLVILPGIVGGCCRCLDLLLDRAISLSRRTVYKPLRSRRKARAGYYAAFVFGVLCNTVSGWVNAVMHGGQPSAKQDYIAVFEERERLFRQSARIVPASAAFSLMMFGIGLVIVVLYLFFA